MQIAHTPNIVLYFQRIDTMRTMAVAHRILIQAEEEGREYITKLLYEFGRSDVVVCFADENIADAASLARTRMKSRQRASLAEAIPFGFVQVK